MAYLHLMREAKVGKYIDLPLWFLDGFRMQSFGVNFEAENE